MVVAIYACPPTKSLHLVNGAIFSRIRPNELFAIDDANSAVVTDLASQGFVIGEYTVETVEVTFSNADHKHAHNPFGLSN